MTTTDERQAPFHRLGVRLDHYSTEEDVLDKAKLADWDVRLTDIQAPDGLIHPGHVGIRRTDPQTGRTIPLGIARSRYTPIQNETIVEIADRARRILGGSWDSAGYLQDGQRVFLTVKLAKDFMIGGKDPVQMYGVFHSGHDGKTALDLAIAPIRMLCTNQLVMIRNHAMVKMSITHHRNAQYKLLRAQEVLTSVNLRLDAFQESAEQMINTPMTKKEYDGLAMRVLKVPTLRQYKADHPKSIRGTEENAKLWHALDNLWHAPSQETIAGTVWAGYNALVEYFDWKQGVRPHTEQERSMDFERNTRAERSLLGPAAFVQQKEKAWTKALEMV